jgi:mediator of RNA polymerase II transcription subunit 31
LEFLQSLASPAYLHYLATAPEKYLQDPHFMAFLRYLKYWKQPEYARLISYPHALYMLDLLLLHYDDTITNATTAEEMTVADGNNITALENPSSQIMEPAKAATSSSASNPTFMNVVARELVNVSFRNFIHQQQFFSWQYRALHLYGGSTTGEEAPFAPPASNCPTEPSSNTAPPDGTSN